jgi:hypothetical protein
MKILISLLFLFILNTFVFCQKKKIKLPSLSSKSSTLSKVNTPVPLTQDQIANGLKEALTQGAKKASEQLNKQDGYNLNSLVRIPFPDEVKQVETTLRKIGLGKKVDEFIVLLNRSAENAAKEAAPIFVNAITSMSITDAKNILTGSDTSATYYLKQNTYDSLDYKFRPHIKSAMDKNLASAYWTDLANTYNKLPTTRTKVNPDLVAYTTGRALKGLFYMIEQEEKNIRTNIQARTTDLLKKVFDEKNVVK